VKTITRIVAAVVAYFAPPPPPPPSKGTDEQLAEDALAAVRKNNAYAYRHRRHFERRDRPEKDLYVQGRNDC
jgi:hypothetical protein